MCALLDHPARIVSCSPMRLNDIWSDIQTVADACGIPERGQALVKALTQRVERIASLAQTLNPKPRVACIEWLEPLMSAGNWVPELVHLAGGVNLFGQPGEHSPWFSWEELLAADPDLLVILPCGFDLPRTRLEMSALTNNPNWHRLRAVQTGAVYLTDGNQYFNRPGPRLVESLEILAEIFHPQTFQFGHQNTAWERYSPA